MNEYIKYTFLLLAVLSCNIESNAQENSLLDGSYRPAKAYESEINITKRVVPYPHLREADVMYYRRVWQEIDLRQKINQPYYYPVEPINDRKSLYDVIKDELLYGGEFQAFSAGPLGKEDEFKFLLSLDSLEKIFSRPRTKKLYDDDGEQIGTEEVRDPIRSDEIKKYRIKEDWIWDRQRSERYVRIIGIAPMVEVTAIVDGEEVSVGWTPLLWLYYPEWRYIFSKYEAFNLLNDAQRRTYEDLFQKRYFSSYIVKEANVYDRYIEDYALGLDALTESERIKEELFLLEHDLWHY